MKNLILFNDQERKQLIHKRKGESKFGEHVRLISNLTSIYDDINNLDVDYVIFGISEDIGVIANYGKTGTYKTWGVVIKFLLNIQDNRFTNGNRICILGHLDYTDEMKAIHQLGTNKKDISYAREMVEQIDSDVSHLVHAIVKAGKTPIVIGGGHNNAYGNIKGSSLALNTPINAINFDAHSDFRPEEGRHSGNGFSYAYAEGFLDRYYIYGLHENYTSEKLFKTLNKIKTVDYCTYDDLEINRQLKSKEALSLASKFIAKSPFGIEIDCDAIENIPSSAMTPSGFSIKQARRFIHYFGEHKHAIYLHICEAAPKSKTEVIVCKLITYLITDFIKA
ncbi:MAG: formimidoylglutamase, partial [Bacteroidota bacterium]